MDLGLTFDDVVLVPGYNDVASRKDVDTSVMMGSVRLDIPIISANMDTITEVDMSRLMCFLGGMGIVHRFMSIQENVDMIRQIGISGNTRNGVSLGLQDGLDRAKVLYELGRRIFCVDVAHGHSKEVGSLVKKLRSEYPDMYIIGGNVATYEGAQYLKDCGADAVKVGIGPGSVCSTRVKTGFGVPQITAIRECSRSEAFIIADGGIRSPGDAVKALAAGADAIMIGGLLAGTDETPGEVSTGIDPKDGLVKKFKTFRGMASREAQEDFHGSMGEYKTSEGVARSVECKGSAKHIIADIMGGIRSGMTYCGARTIRQLKHRARFMQVTTNGLREGTPHYGL